MPATFTVSSGSERVVVYPERSRGSSGGSASVHSPTSSGSRSYSGGSADSWSEVEAPYDDDGIEPSDSASRSRQTTTSRRHTTEARPAPTRRHSSRRDILREEREEPEPRRHRSSRSHHSSRRSHVDSRRVPSDESSGTVASHDDYPYSHHGMPPPRGYPPNAGYRHPHSHGGYPPSMTSGPGYPDPYAAQALIHMPQADAFGYPSSNPFVPPGAGSNPFSPMGSSASTSYFGTEPHAPPMHPHRPPGPPRPQSFAAPSHYGSEAMSPYGGMPPYGYGMHPGMGGYWYPPPSNAGSTEKKNEELEALKALMLKQEEARLAREQEMIKKAEAEAAAAAAKKAVEEEEKKKKEEIAAASKKATEDAEKKATEAAKKAKEEHEKKLKEAQEAKEKAEKKHKELEEVAEKLKPSPDAGKSIRFKDAVNRKFSFPFHLCKTWKGMEGLIRQAFLHVDVIGDHVHQGHYDLTGPDGEIILPQVWDTMIQPDWEVSMHMWPMPENDRLAKDAAALADPFASMGLGDLGHLGMVDPPRRSKSKKDGSKKKKHDPLANLPPSGIPPPPNFPPGGVLPDPLGMAGMWPPGVSAVDDKKRSKGRSKSSSKDLPPLMGWIAGGSSQRPKKDDEKLDLVKQKSARSAEPGACVVM